jgi:polar amino acid transport system substrate-binding protein
LRHATRGATVASVRAVLLALLFAASAAGAAEPALRVGVVPDSPPFVLADRTGHLTGFSVALIQEIGARLKRDVVFTEAPLPALITSLGDGHIDVLAGPVQATPERAADLLFTEGYFWSEYQFGTAPGIKLASLGDLRGKRLAVQDGSEYAEWAARSGDRLGFVTVSEPSLAAVFDAVRGGRADASLTSSSALRAASAGRSKLTAALALPETRTHESLAVAESAVELRDSIEEALRCLKQSGDVARLSTTWLGSKPGPEDLENLVIPGYGVPGLAGYDPKQHKPHCEK